MYLSKNEQSIRYIKFIESYYFQKHHQNAQHYMYNNVLKDTHNTIQTT